MKDLSLQALSRKIDDLIDICQQLDQENRDLKAKVSSWHSEREQLIEKNELVRSKVEAMILRLRALEQQS